MVTSKEVQAAIERFPATFGLRAFPGKTFRIAVDYCYHNGESIQLVTEVQSGGQWLHFARSTPNELAVELVRL